jgi:predicted transcriptional regulator
MVRPAKVSIKEIEAIRNSRPGLSFQEIGDILGVTRATVSYQVRNHGGTLTPRQLVRDHFPYEVPAAQQTGLYKRLRDHGEYFFSAGKGMSDNKLSRLRAFYKRLRDENVVIEYDPDIPPQPGLSITGGWALRPREESDGPLLIRVNQHTKLTDEGNSIWAFPQRDP